MCILLVEDEFLIRLLMAEVLTEDGFEVRQAETGDAAAALIEHPPQAFSLLVTDIHMPGQRDGLGVACVMRKHFPSVPVIYTTARPDILHSTRRLRRNEFLLKKPYLPSELLKAAHRMLAPS